jgi:hypothetical protein
VLTDQGRALFPIVVALMRWGHGLPEGDRGVELVHVGCGAPLLTAVRCAAGHDVPINDTEARLERDRAGSGPSAVTSTS